MNLFDILIDILWLLPISIFVLLIIQAKQIENSFGGV